MAAKIGLRGWVRTVIGDNHYTPDFVSLQAGYEFLPLFIYGTEQMKYSEDNALKNCPRVGVGYLPTSDYVMYQTKEHQPFVLYRPGEGHRVRGEVYLAPPKVIANLDMKNVNGIFSRRSMKAVRWYLWNDKEKRDRPWFETECFTWIGISARMQHQIDNGSAFRKDPVTSKDGVTYYHYRIGDDQPNRVNDRRAL